jgi:hypothetical protein
MIRNDLVITVVFKGLIAMIHLDPIGKKLTQQGFDTFAVLDKLPEMVATLTALAAHLEAHPSSTRTVLGLHLWQSVFAAVHGIKSGDTAVVESEPDVTADLLSALKIITEYYERQGTGRIFNLGYSGDAFKESLVKAAIAKAESQ